MGPAPHRVRNDPSLHRLTEQQPAKVIVIQQIFALSEHIRYVAVYQDSQLVMQSKSGTAGASSSDTDRFEELLVNPTLLKLTSQRGEIDCGGLDYLLIRYGNFFQFVMPNSAGHVSVCLESDSDPVGLAARIKELVERISG